MRPDLFAVDAQDDLKGVAALALVGGAGRALQLHARVGDPERLHEAHIDGARQRADEQVEDRPRNAQPLEQVSAVGTEVRSALLGLLAVWETRSCST
jgi:hypothetical protein